MRQVQDETLRVCSLAPWSARYSDEDVGVCGYQIPSGTPIILLSVWPRGTLHSGPMKRGELYIHSNSPYLINLGYGTLRNSEMAAMGTPRFFSQYP